MIVIHAMMMITNVTADMGYVPMMIEVLKNVI